MKELLLKLQKEKQLEEPSSSSAGSISFNNNESFAIDIMGNNEPMKHSRVLEVFTNTLFEVL